MPRDLRRLVMLAKENDAEAINELGYSYFVGEGVKQDFQKAFEYYLRAANLGHAVAQYNLGLVYAEGKGVPVDGEKAARYYLLSAEQNILISQYSLAFLYHEGRIIKRDLQKAFYWYQKAANANQPNAQHNLGCMYLFGEGVPEDQNKAEEWFLKASDKVIDSQRMLGELYRRRKDDDKAFEWYRKAGEAGDVESIFMLGLFLYSGPDRMRDIRRAAELFAIAARGDHVQARKLLEKMAKENSDAKDLLDQLKNESAKRG